MRTCVRAVKSASRCLRGRSGAERGVRARLLAERPGGRERVVDLREEAQQLVLGRRRDLRRVLPRAQPRVGQRPARGRAGARLSCAARCRESLARSPCAESAASAGTPCMMAGARTGLLLDWLRLSLRWPPVCHFCFTHAFLHA